MLNRRGFLWVLSGAVAAPLVAKAELLMPVRAVQTIPNIKVPGWCPPGWVPADGQTVSRFQFPELYAWFKKTRQYGADLGESFRLPDGNTYSNVNGYSPLAIPVRYSVNRDAVDVPLISVTRLVRSNGVPCAPGMSINHEVTSLEMLQNS